MMAHIKLHCTLVQAVALLLLCTHQAAADEFVTAAHKRAAQGFKGLLFDFFTGDRAEASTNGFQVPSNLGTNPFTATLEGEGNSINLISAGPCAGNAPHTHPRAAEVTVVVKGSFQFGIVEENAGNTRLIIADVQAGQVIFVPQGLIHFSQNLECEPAAFIANFAHRDPGTVTLWPALMQIPTPVLAAGMNLVDGQAATEAMIDKFKQRQIVPTVATGGSECLARCGLVYEKANNLSTTHIQHTFNTSLPGNGSFFVPTDQKGNQVGFDAGDVLPSLTAKRCDFLGLGALPNKTQLTCWNSTVTPDYTNINWRRLLHKLPQDRHTVLDIADLPLNK